MQALVKVGALQSMASEYKEDGQVKVFVHRISFEQSHKDIKSIFRANHIFLL